MIRNKTCKIGVLSFALLKLNVTTARGRNSGAVVHSRDLLGGDWSFLPASENGRMWQHRPAASLQRLLKFSFSKFSFLFFRSTFLDDRFLNDHHVLHDSRNYVRLVFQVSLFYILLQRSNSIQVLRI